MDNIEDNIDNMGIFGHISTVFAEQYQNIMNYAKNEDLDNNEIVPYGYIEVIKTPNNIYEVISSNILSLDDNNKIEPKLIEIKSLDRQAIRKRYRELRKSGENTHSKGGGVGFYEIAKRCIDIEYSFDILDNDKFQFHFKSILGSKKI
jgi:hypothetical protein